MNLCENLHNLTLSLIRKFLITMKLMTPNLSSEATDNLVGDYATLKTLDSEVDMDRVNALTAH